MVNFDPMKIIILLFLLIGASEISFNQELTVLTYNIRFDNRADGVNRWDLRKEKVVSLLQKYDPDIFGIQEGLVHQVSYMDSALLIYDYTGAGRDDGHTGGEYCALFYKTSEYNLLDHGLFWLSETPSVPSVGWDAAFKRICVFGRFEHRNSKTRFLVFNTHLDHMGGEARKKSIQMILDRMNSYNPDSLPVIILGDFNLEPGDEALKPIKEALEDAGRETAVDPAGITGTFNGFRNDFKPEQRIDYIFISRNFFQILEYRVIRDTYHGLFPSDHFPVLARLKFLF
jgi:endonuclease/exonuclease/phosphatase family metal-dependent hydrolase